MPEMTYRDSSTRRLAARSSIPFVFPPGLLPPLPSSSLLPLLPSSTNQFENKRRNENSKKTNLPSSLPSLASTAPLSISSAISGLPFYFSYLISLSLFLCFGVSNSALPRRPFTLASSPASTASPSSHQPQPGIAVVDLSSSVQIQSEARGLHIIGSCYALLTTTSARRQRSYL